MPSEKYPYYLRSIWNLFFEFKPRSQILRVFLQLPIPQDLTIELVKSGIQFKVRGAMDIWTIKETFIDRFYEKYGVPISDGWTILDIGSGIGDFSIFAVTGFPGNKVHAFEPAPKSYDLMLDNLSINNVNNVKTYPYAVWSESQSLVLDTNQIEPGQYTSHSLNGSKISGGEIVVPSLSLEDVFERTGVEQCCLLKIDSEGAEYPILFSAPQHILNSIDRIIMEYHDIGSQYNHQQMEEFLSDNGFDVQTASNYVHPHLGYLYASR